MPKSSRGCRVLLQMTLAWITISFGQSDVIRYGTRLRPLSGSTSHLTLRTQHNHSSKFFSANPKIERDDRSQLSTDENGVARETEPLLNRFYNAKPLQQTNTPIYSEFEKDNPKRPATFFFTQVEPHRFEYRAMFQHEKDLDKNVFQPFVHDFNAFSKEFPPLPKFPTFPDFPEFFNEHKALFPNFHEFNFPTLPPAAKRAWSPITELQPERPVIEDDNLDVTLPKNIDIILGHTTYPKIFRFNEERMNIEDFDRDKKLRFFELAKKEQNELLDHEKVKRDHLLILHGGIFTVQEPPLFNKHMKKRRKPTKFHSRRLRLYKNI